jgi:hypothetical protein
VGVQASPTVAKGFLDDPLSADVKLPEDGGCPVLP